LAATITASVAASSPTIRTVTMPVDVAGVVGEDTPVTITLAIAGPITEIDIHAGQHVQAGQVVARLSDTQGLAAKQAQARAALAEAQSTLDTATSPPSQPQAVAQAQSQVDAAQTALASARAKQHADEAAARTPSVSQQQLDADAQAVAAAQRQLASAQRYLSSVQHPPAAPGSQVSAAQSAVDAAQSGLDAADAGVAQLTITAPYSGTVAVVNQRVGDYASPGTPLARMAGSATIVTANVPPMVAHQLTGHTGTDASIRLAIPDPPAPVTAHLSFVAPAADPQTQQTSVTLTAAAGALTPGEPVTATIHVSLGRQVTVPSSAVSYVDGSAGVYALTGVLDPDRLGISLPPTIPAGARIGTATFTPDRGRDRRRPQRDPERAAHRRADRHDRADLAEQRPARSRPAGAERPVTRGMNITALSIRRPLLVIMFFAALALLGVVATTKLPVTELPKVNFPAVTVVVRYPGASSTTVQQQVTKPVEQSLQEIHGASSITGTSAPGISRVVVDLDSGTNVDSAANQISQAAGRAARALPTGASPPVINEANPDATPLMTVNFTGQDPTGLYRAVSATVQPRIELVSGVGLVDLGGGTQTQADVVIDPARLAARGVSLDQVNSAISGSAGDLSAGTATAGEQGIGTDSQVVVAGSGRSIAALADTVVGSDGTAQVTLGEVATVTEDAASAQATSTLNGAPTVSLTITAQDTANAIATDDAVKHALATVQKDLPAGVSYTIISDTSAFTRAALTATTSDLALAVILASLVILLFLRSWRQTLIVLVAIPASLLTTALLMYLFGFSLDLISLLALSLLIGILVDDAIVVIENITRHLHLGKPAGQAAYDGRTEIGAAAVALTLTDVVVFLPVVFASGITGQILLEFGVTLVAATLVSLLVSFTLTPMLAARWLAGTRPSRRESRGIARRFLAGYERLLRAALRRRWLVLLLAAGAAASSLLLVTTARLSTSYVPPEDAGVVQVSAVLPPGTTLTATADSLNVLAGMISRQIPGVRDIQATAGGRGTGAGGALVPNTGGLVVDLVPKEQRSKSSSQIATEITTMSRLIPGMRARATVPSPLVAPGGNGLQVVLSGSSLSTLSRLAAQAQTVLSGVPQLSRVTNLTNQASPEWQITVDDRDAAAFGLTQPQIAAAVTTAVGGTNPGTVQTSTGETEQILLHLASNVDEQTLLALPVAKLPASGGSGTANRQAQRDSASPAATSAAASFVTLGQVATLTHTSAPQAIADDNGTPQVTVSAGISPGISLSSAVRAVDSAVATVHLPPGYSYELQGEITQQNRSFAPLLLALSLSPLLIYMLLAGLYESLVLPFSVLLAVPLATFGAFLSLIWAGQTLNLFSLIGLLMLIGLVSKNAILLVDRAEHLQADGMPRTEALVHAARTRLRPIVMTTLTVVVAMLPVAFAGAAGSENRAPMAIVLIGGLTSSTLLTLVVVPVLYSYLDAIRSRLGRRSVGPRWHRATATRP
jgi:HAE1 family hydrophobic/amphiphilic exporter-1